MLSKIFLKLFAAVCTAAAAGCAAVHTAQVAAQRLSRPDSLQHLHRKHNFVGVDFSDCSGTYVQWTTAQQAALRPRPAVKEQSA